MRKEIQFKNILFWTDASEIVYSEVRNNDPRHQLKRIDVKLYIDAISTLCNGKAMPFIADLRGIHGAFSVRAAKLLSKSPDLARLIILEAYVTDTLDIRLLVASYKRLYDPITPFGIFDTIEDAKDFCNEYKKTVHGSI